MRLIIPGNQPRPNELSLAAANRLCVPIDPAFVVDDGVWILLGARRFQSLSRYSHTELEEKFLYVAQTQLKLRTPALSAADESAWETVTMIKRFRSIHHAIFGD
jgi:hypothetical protein